LFMDVNQSAEWNFEGSLDWHLAISVTWWCKKIDYRFKLAQNSACFAWKQFSPEGFEWINYSDHQNAVMSFIRKGDKPKDDNCCL
jgi:1,4-alpha-glucan branching enzyme